MYNILQYHTMTSQLTRPRPTRSLPARWLGTFALLAAALAGQPTRLVATHYFYWYDWPTQHFNQPGAPGREGHHHHFPDPEHVSYRSEAWHEKQLAAMAKCGIDFALPVYWGAPGAYDRPGLAFSRLGLPPMVEAVEALARRGLRIRLGLFYDTSTLLDRVRGVRPLDGRADLTTAVGKRLFCDTVLDYFAAVPERDWARVEGRALVVLYGSAFAARWDRSLGAALRAAFRERFADQGVFLVADASWGEIGQDRTTQWGAALAGPRLHPGVAQIGPGYDDSAVPGRRTPRRDRENGAFYRHSWRRAVLSAPELVLIETWNEMHEGTEICETVETARRYLDLTEHWISIFKSGGDPGPPVPLRHPEPLPRPDYSWGEVAADLPRVECDYAVEPTAREGLREVAHEDGPLAPIDFALCPAAGTGTPTYLYFQVSDYWRFDVDADFTLEVVRRPGGVARVEYDSRDSEAALRGAYTPVTAARCSEEEGLLVETYRLPHARFANRQNAGADLRFLVRGGHAGLLRVTLRPAE